MIPRASAGKEKWASAPLEIGIKNHIFLEKPEVGILNSD